MRVCSIRGLSFFGFLMALSWSTTGWCQTPEEIDAARKRGVDYLLSSQEKDGSWSFKDTTYPVGPTALVGLALMENGIPISDSHIEKANKYINDKIKDLKNTYEISLSLVFLSRVGDRDSRATVRELAARLIAGQNGDGGWGYACPLATIGLLTDPKQKPKTIEGIGDNSCTQFATLALWVASRSGVNIDDAMLKVGERFLDTPRYTGGWTYNHDKMETPDTPTMTFAGMFCLTVAHANRIRAQAEHRI